MPHSNGTLSLCAGWVAGALLLPSVPRPLLHHCFSTPLLLRRVARTSMAPLPAAAASAQTRAGVQSRCVARTVDQNARNASLFAMVALRARKGHSRRRMRRWSAPPSSPSRACTSSNTAYLGGGEGKRQRVKTRHQRSPFPLSRLRMHFRSISPPPSLASPLLGQSSVSAPRKHEKERGERGAPEAEAARHLGVVLPALLPLGTHQTAHLMPSTDQRTNQIPTSTKPRT